MKDLGRALHPEPGWVESGDLAGLVACGGYRDGRRVEDVPVHECGRMARSDDTVLWVGLYEPGEPLLHIVAEQLHLHELLIEDVHQAHQRPKLELYGDVLFLVVHTAQLIDGEIKFGETHLILGKGYVVSIRHGASTTYATVRERCERSPELLKIGESFILYAILDFITDNYYPIVDQITEELEQIENDIFSSAPGNDKIERIYRLRAMLLGLRRSIAPMGEICNRLGRHDFPATAAVIQPYLRDLHDHVLQVGDAIADLRERLTSAFEASLLLASASQNEIVKKLASWGAIIAVPTLIAGVYGMNFKDIPEFDVPGAYFVCLAIMAGLSGYLYYRFKRSDWL